MKNRVSVESVKEGPDRIDVLIVAWGKQKVEGKDQEVPLGEKAMSFPAGTSKADIVKAIKEAAVEIEQAAAHAKATRTELNKLLKEEPAE